MRKKRIFVLRKVRVKVTKPASLPRFAMTLYCFCVKKSLNHSSAKLLERISYCQVKHRIINAYAIETVALPYWPGWID
jgi:hypothetical protein